MDGQQVEFSNELTTKLVSSQASDESVVAAARVSVIGPESEEYLSTPAEESRGLINFLMKNRHGTPFEHTYFTFFVEAPIAVYREWHRHRIGWSYNEESGRYKKLRPKFYVPPPYRPLIQVGKPGHYTFEPGDDTQYDLVARSIGYACVESYAAYENMLDGGVAKEVARGVLPVYTFSSMYATCNARSLMSFLSLRTKDERSTFPSFPMWEIQECALQMEGAFAAKMPITHAAFCNNGRVAP